MNPIAPDYLRNGQARKIFTLATRPGMTYIDHMSTLSIPLPEEDLAFLRSFAQEQGISAEGFLAQHARNLRLQLQAGLHPSVKAASGAFQATADPLAEFHDDMARKHQ